MSLVHGGDDSTAGVAEQFSVGAPPCTWAIERDAEKLTPTSPPAAEPTRAGLPL